jgi:hypothetical protein
MTWDAKRLKKLGIKNHVDTVRKLFPEPTSLKPTKEALKLLNKAFGRRENRIFHSTEFNAFLPWENNPEKKWYLVVDSIPVSSDKRTKVIEKVIRKKYPDYKFEIRCTVSTDIHSRINENLGTWLKKR